MQKIHCRMFDDINDLSFARIYSQIVACSKPTFLMAESLGCPLRITALMASTRTATTKKKFQIHVNERIDKHQGRKTRQRTDRTRRARNKEKRKIESYECRKPCHRLQRLTCETPLTGRKNVCMWYTRSLSLATKSFNSFDIVSKHRHEQGRWTTTQQKNKTKWIQRMCRLWKWIPFCKWKTIDRKKKFHDNDDNGVVEMWPIVAAWRTMKNNQQFFRFLFFQQFLLSRCFKNIRSTKRRLYFFPSIDCWSRSTSPEATLINRWKKAYENDPEQKRLFSLNETQSNHWNRRKK